ncbi:MAG: hypothetical protein V1873_04005 [Verrucomicrobiota bacterium]
MFTRFSVVVALLFALSLSALGQGFGLQVADTAGPGNAGAMRVTAGLVMGKFADSDVSFYGARYTYVALESLSVFGDVGAVKLEDPFEVSPSFQVGALYSLPIDTLPVDLGLRGTLFKPLIKDVTEDGVDLELSVWGMSFMLVGSGCLEAAPELSLYGGIGAVYWEAEWRSGAGIPPEDDIHFQAISKDSDTEFALTAGALYQLDDAWSVYGEASYIDDMFFGAGVRLDF